VLLWIVVAALLGAPDAQAQEWAAIGWQRFALRGSR
jgi:hypothetical protein